MTKNIKSLKMHDLQFFFKFLPVALFLFLPYDQIWSQVATALKARRNTELESKKLLSSFSNSKATSSLLFNSKQLAYHTDNAI